MLYKKDIPFSNFKDKIIDKDCLFVLLILVHLNELFIQE